MLYSLALIWSLQNKCKNKNRAANGEVQLNSVEDKRVQFSRGQRGGKKVRNLKAKFLALPNRPLYRFPMNTELMAMQPLPGAQMITHGLGHSPHGGDFRSYLKH